MRASAASAETRRGEQDSCRSFRGARPRPPLAPLSRRRELAVNRTLRLEILRALLAEPRIASEVGEH